MRITGARSARYPIVLMNREKGIAAMIKHLRLKAYGKINLALDVLGKRDNGYHDVRMIMQTVGLHDRIELYRTKSQVSVWRPTCFTFRTMNRIWYTAAALLIEEFGVKEGVSIQLKKFIPVSAGMAGGSTDAAAVLFGVNKMFGLGLSIKRTYGAWCKAGSRYPILPDAWNGTFRRDWRRINTASPDSTMSGADRKAGISVSTKVVYESLDAMELKTRRPSGY